MGRDHLGRYLGKISYWLHNEDENWEDIRVSPEDIMFPHHSEDKIYPVQVWNLNDIK